MKFLSAKKTIGGCQQSGFLKNLNFSLFCPRLPKIWGVPNFSSFPYFYFYFYGRACARAIRKSGAVRSICLFEI